MTYIYFEVKLWVILTHNCKVLCLYMKFSSRYKAKSLICENSSRYEAKSLEHEKQVIPTFTSLPISKCYKVDRSPTKSLFCLC